MKVLITGGAGFIGCNLARRLLELGNEVTVMDNFSFGGEKNLEEIKKDIKLVNADITSQDIAGHFEGQDVIFHLAAIADAKYCSAHFQEAVKTNVEGTANVLNAAHKSGADKVIFTSSAYVYGDPAYVPIDEKHPLSISNEYALTKR